MFGRTETCLAAGTQELWKNRMEQLVSSFAASEPSAVSGNENSSVHILTGLQVLDGKK